MNFFHAFLKLTISLLKNKSAQTFLFFIFEKEQKKSRKTLILRELLFPCGETGFEPTTLTAYISATLLSKFQIGNETVTIFNR